MFTYLRYACLDVSSGVAEGWADGGSRSVVNRDCGLAASCGRSGRTRSEVAEEIAARERIVPGHSAETIRENE